MQKGPKSAISTQRASRMECSSLLWFVLALVCGIISDIFLISTVLNTSSNSIFALKHRASLVWAPEFIDTAILHSEGVVNCKGCGYSRQ
ncbi:hypothetical protein BDP27DRAFT_768647 [Rhodocollybia butyracea]|uniref:Uncharacterized protein n=1 Tax=Rhodocollybia butyracea TaxID=206335 RepID=A0A9P5PMV7_9AGAR|nr:hypothetical protein BDP27DRAFT_768647 [Rhodocollybia butyracea]